MQAKRAVAPVALAIPLGLMAACEGRGSESAEPEAASPAPIAAPAPQAPPPIAAEDQPEAAPVQTPAPARSPPPSPRPARPAAEPQTPDSAPDASPPLTVDLEPGRVVATPPGETLGEYRARMDGLFTRWDLNRNGHIEGEEWNATSRRAQWEAADVDVDQRLSRREFDDAAHRRFQTLDDDGDGLIALQGD